MNFGEALEKVKSGKKIQREGWNGKNQFVELGSHVSYVRPNGEVVNANHEAMGKHFQGNPYRLERDTLIPRSREVIDCIRSFDGIRDWLKENKVEGIVFRKDGEPQCKIKRSDFGFEWPVKG